MSILSAEYHKKEGMKNLLYISIKECKAELDHEYNKYNRAQAEAINFKIKNFVDDQNKVLNVKLHETRIKQIEGYINRLNNILALVSSHNEVDYDKVFSKFISDLKEESIVLLSNERSLNQLSFEVLAVDPRYHINFAAKNKHEKIQQEIDAHINQINQLCATSTLLSLDEHTFEPLLQPDAYKVFESLYERKKKNVK